MTTFRVDLDELERTELCLRRVSAKLSALDDGTAIDGHAFGSHLVRDTFSTFRRKWSDGLHRIAETTDNTADILGESRNAYETTERGIVAASSGNAAA